MENIIKFFKDIKIEYIIGIIGGLLLVIIILITVLIVCCCQAKKKGTRSRSVKNKSRNLVNYTDVSEKRQRLSAYSPYSSEKNILEEPYFNSNINNNNNNNNNNYYEGGGYGSERSLKNYPMNDSYESKMYNDEVPPTVDPEKYLDYSFVDLNHEKIISDEWNVPTSTTTKTKTSSSSTFSTMNPSFHPHSEEESKRNSHRFSSGNGYNNKKHNSFTQSLKHNKVQPMEGQPLPLHPHHQTSFLKNRDSVTLTTTNSNHHDLPTFTTTPTTTTTTTTDYHTPRDSIQSIPSHLGHRRSSSFGQTNYKSFALDSRKAQRKSLTQDDSNSTLSTITTTTSHRTSRQMVKPSPSNGINNSFGQGLNLNGKDNRSVGVSVRGLEPDKVQNQSATYDSQGRSQRRSQGLVVVESGKMNDQNTNDISQQRIVTREDIEKPSPSLYYYNSLDYSQANPSLTSPTSSSTYHPLPSLTQYNSTGRNDLRLNRVKQEMAAANATYNSLDGYFKYGKYRVKSNYPQASQSPTITTTTVKVTTHPGLPLAETSFSSSPYTSLLRHGGPSPRSTPNNNTSMIISTSAMTKATSMTSPTSTPTTTPSFISTSSSVTTLAPTPTTPSINPGEFQPGHRLNKFYTGQYFSTPLIRHGDENEDDDDDEQSNTSFSSFSERFNASFLAIQNNKERRRKKSNPLKALTKNGRATQENKYFHTPAVEPFTTTTASMTSSSSIFPISPISPITPTNPFTSPILSNNNNNNNNNNNFSSISRYQHYLPIYDEPMVSYSHDTLNTMSSTATAATTTSMSTSIKTHPYQYSYDRQHHYHTRRPSASSVISSSSTTTLEGHQDTSMYNDSFTTSVSFRKTEIETIVPNVRHSHRAQNNYPSFPRIQTVEIHNSIDDVPETLLNVDEFKEKDFIRPSMVKYVQVMPAPCLTQAETTRISYMSNCSSENATTPAVTTTTTTATTTTTTPTTTATVVTMASASVTEATAATLVTVTH